MRIYKFISQDGHYAFICALSEVEATSALKKLTSVPFKLVGSKKPEELNRPIVLFNNMLPF